MDIYRGDTLIKKLTSKTCTFKNGDKFHVAILKKVTDSEYLFEDTITIDTECNEFNLEIKPSDTAKLPTGKLLLEIELTTATGVVSTKQCDIKVKADGIYDRV